MRVISGKYKGRRILVESKSQYRPTLTRIREDIVNLLSPIWLRIGGFWYPRGGIPIDIFWQTSQQPKNLFIPDMGISLYRGR